MNPYAHANPLPGDIPFWDGTKWVYAPPPPPFGSTSFDGANFQFTWDGAPLADGGFYEIDSGAAGVSLDSFGICVRFRSLLVGAIVGAHTLAVQWNVNVLGDIVTSFIGSGNLTVQSAPQ